MQILDHEPGRWFLFQDGDELLLDVNCNHGVFGYSHLMALDGKETARFKAEGRGFIEFLAEMVERSEPGIRGTVSPYKDRAVAPERSSQATAAVLAWRAEGGGG